MKYIISEKGATFLLGGRTVMISSSHVDWAAILAIAGSDPDRLGQILTPEVIFAADQKWNTRGGSLAVVTGVEGRKITALIDDCFEVELIAGMVSPGVELDDDLMELVA